MSHILTLPRVLLCLYCGQACSRGRDGEHIIPKAIGGRRTLNDATDRVAVCQECNNGPLAEADKELVGRSYLSVIASQRLNSLVWQTWDIDHRTGELIEALPVWSPAGEMLAFRCRPQLLFTGARIAFYADHLQTMEFGFAHAYRVLTRAAYACFRETVNGGQNRIHYHRVHRHSFADDYPTTREDPPMTPPPVHDDRDCLRRAQALGWQIAHFDGVGRRLVPPHTLPPNSADEATLVALCIGQRIHALLALLNPPAESPTQASPSL